MREAEINPGTHTCQPPRRSSTQAWRLLATVSVLLVFSGLQARAATLNVGPAIDLPWMTDVHYFETVTAAVVENGSFAIAADLTFQLTSQDYTWRFQAQFFDATGAAQTRPLVLIRSPFADGGIGSVGTSYFLAWEDSEHARATIYSEQGKPIGEPFAWPYSDIFAFASYYSFGSAPGWRFEPTTYVYAGLDAQGNAMFQTVLRAAEPTGTLLGRPYALGSATIVEDVAINGSGRLVVVSHECPPCSRSLQIFDDGVKPLTALISANVPSLADNSNSAVVALDAEGNVLLGWVTDFDKPDHELVARLYDQAGSPVSGVFQLGTASPLIEPLPHGLKALDDGTFVAAWLVPSGVHNDTDRLYVEHFNPRTGVFAPPVLVAQGNIAGATVAVNNLGKGVAVWETQEFVSGSPVSTAGHFSVVRVDP